MTRAMAAKQPPQRGETRQPRASAARPWVGHDHCRRGLKGRHNHDFNSLRRGGFNRKFIERLDARVRNRQKTETFEQGSAWILRALHGSLFEVEKGSMGAPGAGKSVVKLFDQICCCGPTRKKKKNSGT